MFALRLSGDGEGLSIIANKQAAVVVAMTLLAVMSLVPLALENFKTPALTKKDEVAEPIVLVTFKIFKGQLPETLIPEASKTVCRICSVEKRKFCATSKRTFAVSRLLIVTKKILTITVATMLKMAM